MNHYDTIVVGVGGIGSATTYHLAKQGQDILGLEQYNIPHNKGSSHGKTRLIRLSYFNHPSYVPLLHRAYELWEKLDNGYPWPLLNITGSLDIGPPESDIFKGAKKSCDIHNLDYETLNGENINEKYPAFDIPPTHQAIYQSDGGFLYPEQCIVAHVRAANYEGAEIHAQEQVKNWNASANNVHVTTDRGEYTADNIVITSGAWAAKQLDLLNPLTPEERTLAWFQPKITKYYQPTNLPVFHLNVDENLYYGTPVFNVPGLKIGMYNHPTDSVDPDQLDRTPRREDEMIMREVVEDYLPSAAGPTVGLQSCIVTNTPDNDFVIDIHPEKPTIVIGAGFSGHGFKFSPVIGEILADLTINGTTTYDIENFRSTRFS